MSPVSSNRTFIQTFHFRPDGSPKTVHITGNFDSWGRSVVMKPTTSDPGLWEAIVQLPLLASGQIQYKYVLDGQNWVCDDHADKFTLPSGITNNCLPVPKDAVNYSWSQASTATFQGDIQSPGLGTGKNKRKNRRKSKKTLAAGSEGKSSSDAGSRSSPSSNGSPTPPPLTLAQDNAAVAPSTAKGNEPIIDGVLPSQSKVPESRDNAALAAGAVGAVGAAGAASALATGPLNTSDATPTPSRVEKIETPPAIQGETVAAKKDVVEEVKETVPKTEEIVPRTVDHTAAEDFLPKASSSTTQVANASAEPKMEAVAPDLAEETQKDEFTVLANSRATAPTGTIEPTSTPKQVETISAVTPPQVLAPAADQAAAPPQVAEPVKAAAPAPVQTAEAAKTAELAPVQAAEPVKAAAPAPAQAAEAAKAPASTQATTPTQATEPAAAAPAPAASPAKTPETKSGKKSSKKGKSSPPVSGDSAPGSADSPTKKKKGIFGKLKKIFNNP